MNRLWKFNCRLAGRKIDGGVRAGFTEVYRNWRDSGLLENFLSGDIHTYTCMVVWHDRLAAALDLRTRWWIFNCATETRHLHSCVYIWNALHAQPYVHSILSLPPVTDAILTYGFRGGSCYGWCKLVQIGV